MYEVLKHTMTVMWCYARLCGTGLITQSYYTHVILHIPIYTCRVELEAEIRLQVDELMREELKNLKLVGML